ncbi:AIR synthase family protein [Eubacteriales bacterium KG127]
MSEEFKIKDEILPIGKLDSEQLKSLVFDNLTYRREDVRTRSGLGLDCAILDFGEFDCVISTDPISAATKDIGRLAVHINCNDIATQGIAPMAMTLVLMLPEGTKAKQLYDIMRQAGQEAAALGVEIVGGHTEITDSVTKPVAIATCFGKALCGKKSGTVKPGQKILLSKYAGLEGTGIICSDMEEKLGFLNQEELDEGKNMLSMLSVVKEGVVAGEEGCSAMHDVTEGGVLGAVWEMCQAGQVGAVLYEKKIPVKEVTKKLGKVMGFDYLRLISSGSMVIIADSERVEPIARKCGTMGIGISEIGEILPQEEGCSIKRIIGEKGSIETQKIDPPGSDHLYIAFKFK